MNITGPSESREKERMGCNKYLGQGKIILNLKTRHGIFKVLETKDKKKIDATREK
jgi:hypothetical protein